MAKYLSGSQSIAINVFQALNGQAPTKALLDSYVAAIGTTNGYAWANSMASTSGTDAAFAATLLANLGISATTLTASTAWPVPATTFTELQTQLTAYLTAAGVANRGTVAAQLASIVTNLEGDAVYGAAALTYNNQALADFNYASNTANVTPGTPAATGVTFTLTTSVDTGSAFTGGAGNDTFYSIDNNVAATGTFTSADSLTGGAGTDTLNIAVSGTGAAPSVSTNGIENLSIINNGTNAPYTLSAALFSGLQKVTTTAGGNAVSITNATGILNAELISTNQNLTLASAAAAVVGDADSANIALQAAGTSSSITVTNNGIENFNVALSTGASGSSTTTVTVASDQLESVVLTGSVAAYLVADLTGSDLPSQVGVFNASAASGGIAATVTAGSSGKLSVTGGTGNDTVTVTMDTTANTANTTLAGGDGTDTLVATGGTYNSTYTTQAGANVTGFEVAGGSVDQRVYTNNTFTSSKGAGSFTKMAATFLTSNLAADGALTVTRGTDTTSNALTVNLTNTAAGTATITAVDEETLTINSAGTVAGILHTVSLSDTDLTTLTITGSNALAMGALDSTAVATINASAHTGATFTVDASAATTAVTITASAGAPATVGGIVNNITGGTLADSITGGIYADSLVGGVGADTIIGGEGNNTLDGGTGNDSITGGAGNDVITGGTGNDIINAGDGNNTVSDTGGDDSITAGAGNDSINGGGGNNTIVAGAGNDLIGVTSLSDSSSTDGGTGTDVLSAVATTITASSASGVNSAFITMTGDAAPTVAGVETIYFSAVSDTASTAAIPTVLTMTGVTGVTTLNLKEVAPLATTALKVLNFAGTTINLFGATGTAVEDKFTTFDGVGQSSLTLNLNDYDAVPAGTTTVTGVTNLTIAGKSTSQFTGTADQGNSLIAVTAATVDSLTITTSGSAAANAAAYSQTSVSAAQANALTLTAGANDKLLAGTVTLGANLLNATLSTGTVGLLGVTSLTATGSALDALTINVGESGNLSSDGAGTAAATFAFTSVAALATTLNAGSTASIDLTGDVVTAGTFSLATGSTLKLTSGFGSGASSFVFTGRGDLDDAGGTNTFALAGTTVTFNTSGLTADADNMTVTTATTGASTISTGLGADTITGGAGNDVINGGAGADVITGGAGADVLTGGTGIDVYSFAAGDSTATIAGTGDAGTITLFDRINGFAAADGTIVSETLNVAGTGAIAPTTAGTNGTDSTLTIGGVAIKSHAISAAGLVTFDDLDVYAAALTIDSSAKVAAAVQYLTTNDIGAAGDSVVFGDGTNTWVFTQTGAGAGGDVVELVGVTGVTSLITANATTNHAVFIA